MNTLDHKTKDFLEKIDYLISRGVIKNQAEVVNTLNWNKSVMSSVKNGSLPVPQHIYNKFKEVYAEQLTNNPDQNGQDYKDKYIQLLERMDKERIELLNKVSLSLERLPGSMEMLTDLILKGQDQTARKLEDGLNRNLKELSKRIDSLPLNVPDRKQVSKGKH